MLTVGEKFSYIAAHEDPGTAGQLAAEFVSSLYGGLYEDNSTAVFVEPNMLASKKDDLLMAFDWYKEEKMPDKIKWVEDELNVPGMPDIGKSITYESQFGEWQNGSGINTYILLDEFGSVYKGKDNKPVSITRQELEDAWKIERAARRKRQLEAEKAMIP